MLRHRLRQALPVRQLTGEGDERREVRVSLLPDVFVERQLVAHRLLARARHDHRLRPSVEHMLHVLSEVLDDDLDLLADVVRVQPHPAHQRLECPGLVHLLVVVLRTIVCELESHPIGRVVLEHVEDEALLDRLLHRVGVKRPGLTVGARAPEAHQRLALRSRGERKERDVAVLRAGLHKAEHHVLGGVFFGFLSLARRQYLRQVVRAGARLRGVRLIGYDRERALPQRGVLADLVEHEREGLQRNDDDRGAVLQRLDELLRLDALALDPDDNAFLVLELVDRLLQLGIEHRAVGDDDHRGEHLAVGLVVQALEAVSEPRDGVGLARARRVLHEVVVARTLPARGIYEEVHRLPLVVARKDERLARLATAVLPHALLALKVDEVAQDAQPAIVL